MTQSLCGRKCSNGFATVTKELIEKKAREGLAEPTLEKMRWCVKLLGTDFGKRPMAAGLAQITKRSGGNSRP